jgi:beta-glucanase (GH16 family)
MSNAQVFSDEFQQDGRTFVDGNDPRWSAINKNDCTYNSSPAMDTHSLLPLILSSLGFVFCRAPAVDTNAALHFYSEDNIRTTNGVLNITTEQKTNAYRAFDEVKKEFYADKKYVQSGMIQSWNKFCFTGGAVEFSAKLPGDPHKGGLWPARKCSIVLSDRNRSDEHIAHDASLISSMDAGQLGQGIVRWIV